MNTLDPRTLLRHQLRARRRALPAAARRQAALALPARLEALPGFARVKRLAAYLPVASEFDPRPAMQACLQAGLEILAPVLVDGDRLGYRSWWPDVPLAGNRYGIDEPQSGPTLRPAEAGLDLVLVPLLGFDRNGNRLGSGAGYYDRSFAFLAPPPRPDPPWLLGLAFSCQELPELAAESWDVALDGVLTEAELIGF